VSGCVALRLPLTGSVVTWFVTGFRISVRTGSLAVSSGLAETKLQHDHGAMTEQAHAKRITDRCSRCRRWSGGYPAWRLVAGRLAEPVGVVGRFPRGRDRQ
jgi:hypothetical protein